MDNENVLNVLRSIINDYGRKYNMTPTEIAKKCDIGRSTIFYIAAGNYKSSVTQKIIDKILNGLDCSYSEYYKMLETNLQNYNPNENGEYIKISKNSKLYVIVSELQKLSDDKIDLVHSLIKNLK